MEQLEIKPLHVVFSAALSAFISYLGAVVIPIAVLIVAMVIDYATGMAAAWHNKELSSKRGLFGIVKKVSYLALVSVGMIIDWIIISGLQQVNIQFPLPFIVSVILTIWLIVNELISILENLDAIGVPQPKFLIKIIKRLKATTEKTMEIDEEKWEVKK